MLTVTKKTKIAESKLMSAIFLALFSSVFDEAVSGM